MLKRIGTIIFSLTMVIFYTPANALDLRVQPRFKTGIQFYEFEQPALKSPAPGTQGLFQNTQSSIEFSDWLPFVGGGVTLFVDRFFVDFDVQYLFDGDVDPTFKNQTFIPATNVSPNIINRNDTVLDAEFDRFEWAVSAGLEVYDNLVIFGGYKYAKTSSNSNVSGNSDSFLTNNAPIPQLSGKVLGEVDLDFEYEGPFVGMNYNWRVKQGFLDGGLSFNFAAAFLDSKTKINLSKVAFSGQPTPLAFPETRFTALEGDSVGYSFGVGWQGLTSVQGLSYLAGVTGYRYEFEGNETIESRVRIDFGLSYAFDY